MDMVNEIIPFLATAGGVFMTYLALGRWIKGWMTGGLVSKETVEEMLAHTKEEYNKELQRTVEQINKDIEKNTVWLRDLDHKADRAMVEMSGLQEAINGVRERLREGR
jgi:chromosome segregation ATPase